MGRLRRARCSASTTRTPSRSPFWAWLIDEVHAAPPRRPVPGRGVHPPRGDAPPGQDRLQPVLHLLHLEERPLGADRVRLRAGLLRRAGVLPPELLRQHARHPARVPPARRPAGVRGAARAGAPRSAPATGSTRATRTSRTCRSREGSEEYLHSEKYEIKQRALDGPLLPMIARAQPRPPGQPGAAGAVEHHLPGHGQRRPDRLRQAHRRRHGDLRRLLDPLPAPAGSGQRAGQPRPAADLHRARRALRRALPVAHRRTTSSRSPPAGARPTS